MRCKFHDFVLVSLKYAEMIFYLRGLHFHLILIMHTYLQITIESIMNFLTHFNNKFFLS